MTEGADPRVLATHQRAAEQGLRYDQLMREVANQVDGYCAGDRGDHIDNSVKSVERLGEKAERSHTTTGDLDTSLLNINDLNRYTFVLPEADYTAGVEQICARLADQGFVIDPTKISNRWSDPYYKGYHVTFRDPDRPHPALDPDHADASSKRHPIEVQFHTPASYAAKQETHDLYELAHSGQLDPDQKRAAMELQARRTDQVPIPPGQERLTPRHARERFPAERIPPEAFAQVEQLREAARERATEPEIPAQFAPEQSAAGDRDHYWDDAARDDLDRGGAGRGLS